MLNTSIGKMIQAGELLLLSLKQVKDVVLKVVNFNRSDEETLMAKHLNRC